MAGNACLLPAANSSLKNADSSGVNADSSGVNADSSGVNADSSGGRSESFVLNSLAGRASDGFIMFRRSRVRLTNLQSFIMFRRSRVRLTNLQKSFIFQNACEKAVDRASSLCTSCRATSKIRYDPSIRELTMATSCADVRCLHCDAVLPKREIEDGWCDSCGKRLPLSIRGTSMKMTPAPKRASDDSAPRRARSFLWVAAAAIGLCLTAATALVIFERAGSLAAFR